MKQFPLTKEQLIVLFVAILFWMFDGYETYALILTIIPALHTLLPPSQIKHISLYAGYLIASTLAGWATGGVVGGRIGDAIGRKKTMAITVFIYSIFTFLSSFSINAQMLGVFRFLTGIGIGAEWNVGTALLQESWPSKLRTKGAGVLQSGFSLGFFVASAVYILMVHLGLSWRWMFRLGVIPIFAILALYKRIPESAAWSKAVASPSPKIFKTYRKYLALALLVSISITMAWWAISTWIPSYVATLATTDKAYYSGLAGALYSVGEIVGCVVFGLIADPLGRQKTSAIYFIGSLVITPIVFLVLKSAISVVLAQTVNGFFTGGIYSWFAVQPAELFPTKIRATALGVIFNSSRYLAVMGILVSSFLIQIFHGYSFAATAFGMLYILGLIVVFFIPETAGKPLPA
jgi:MFS family permease